MDKIARSFNLLLLIIIGILSAASLAALVVIHWNFSKQSFSFTASGVNTYLSAYGEYKALFTGTVATIAAFFGLHRLNAATEANVQKAKQDRYSDWKTVLDVRFIDIEKNDPCMKREFIRVRFKFYEELCKINFNIENKQVLTNIFQKVFVSLVPFFEELNETHIQMGGVYPNNLHSYSLDAFHFLFIGSIGEDYSGISADLKDLYLANLPANRIIDPDTYKTAQLRNIRRPILQ